MSAAALFFLRFIAVVGSVLAGAHYYLWRRLVKDTGLSGRAKRAGTAALAALFLLPLLSRLLEQHLPHAWLFPFLWLAYLWLGMLLLFFFFLCADSLKILALAGRCLLRGGDVQGQIRPAGSSFRASRLPPGCLSC